ncbi:MAG: hypothetical protein QF733_07475 [Phycisphaerales bacterium]|jgi:hypothetical protein|nr:hypothetical protein [Phycisphaerales bacterium]
MATCLAVADPGGAHPGAADPAALRSDWDSAEGPRQRVTAGLTLLEYVLGEAWTDDLVVDMALLGLPDPPRRASAMAVVDEAIVVSSAVDADLRACAGLGIRVGLDAERWRHARGVACAAGFLLQPDDPDLAAEAAAHLQPGRDARSRRMAAHLRWARGDADAAAEAAAVAEDPTAPPIEQAAARAVLARYAGGDGWRKAVEAASAPWEVAMVAESSMAGASSTAEALRMVGPARQALERTGMPSEAAFTLALDLASRVGGAADLDGAVIEDLDVAAVIAASRQSRTPAAAVGWLQRRLGRPLEGRDAAAAQAALGEALERAGRPAEAMAAWRAAAERGAAASGHHWDQAARLAAALAERSESSAAVEVLEHASKLGGHAAAWARTLATLEARAGREAEALERLLGVAPGGAAHLEAMSHVGVIIAARRSRLGVWDPSDAAILREARAAALAAATQTRDAPRAAMARPVTAALAAVLVEHELDARGVVAATELLERDPALAWLVQDDRRRLLCRVALAGGDYSGVAVLAREGGAAFTRDLLLHARSLPAAEASMLIRAVDIPPPAGSMAEHLAVAGLLARGGAAAHAVAWYDAVLDEDPSVLEAVLGRCECLRGSENRAVLADVAAGYRRIASLPREEDPARWRLANLRLIEVLRRAGADAARLDARLARLRKIDPELGTSPP